jgi:hypothetical protein
MLALGCARKKVGVSDHKRLKALARLVDLESE